MNISGLTDSIASVSSSPNECPSCRSTSQVAGGLCLGCMLEVGIGNNGSDNPAELAAALDAVAVPDTHWRLGNYEILEEIGRGGMGVIYRARQRHSRRIVAVKRILSYHADSRETLARFRREAQAAASLDHPNILPIYEVAESEEGVPYFSMKYAPGGSLQHAGGALRNNPREIVRLMAKVTRAVQYAHRQGILHRDLKPGNILLDGQGEPLVSDFGLAKWLDTNSDLTRTLTIFGTPGYIAPEQAKGSPANLKPTADVYSLGAILFDLLAGCPPFLGDHAIAVIHQAGEKPAPKLRSLVKTADRDLETICSKCLEREPDLRYRTAGDLAEDLERWLEGRPIIARPVSPPVKLWRWTVRNPAMAGAALIALLLGAAVILVQSSRRHAEQALHEQLLYKHSVAVLPFLDLDTGSINRDFARLLANSLKTQMSTLGPARIHPVLSDSLSLAVGSTDEIRDATNRAGARTVLLGTVRQVGKKLSLSTHLIEASSNQILLHRYFTLDNVTQPAIRLPDSTVAEIFSAFDTTRPSPASSPDPALQNPGANEYLRAGHEFEIRRDRLSLDHALECFQKAIDAEPSSALARADFAKTALTRFYYSEASPDLLLKAEKLSFEASKLNPTLPEVHRALCGIFYNKGDVLGSREQALEAIELGGLDEGPVKSVAKTTEILGRPDQALRWHQIGQLIQEHPADYESDLADCWTMLCADQPAKQLYERVITLHPDLPEGWIGLCRLRLLSGDSEGAHKICRDNLTLYPQFPFATAMAAQVEFFSRNWTEAERLYRQLAAGDPDGGGESYGAVTFQSALGRLRQLAGDKPAAEKLLESCLATASKAVAMAPAHPDALYRLAAIEASLGKSDLALQHLEAAFRAGRLDYRSLLLDPRFDELKTNPRFTQISQAMAARVASLRAVALNQH